MEQNSQESATATSIRARVLVFSLRGAGSAVWGVFFGLLPDEEVALCEIVGRRVGLTGRGGVVREEQ